MLALEHALITLRDKPLKSQTIATYLRVLKELDLEDTDMSEVSVALLTQRLNLTINTNTRRRQAIALRSMLGVPLKAGYAEAKEYDLASYEDYLELFSKHRHGFYARCMLQAGLRIGEALTKQQLKGNVLDVQRQLQPDNSIARAKSTGKVLVPASLADEYRERQEFEKSRMVLQKSFLRLSNKVGFDCNAHALRHAYATELVRRGATPEVLRRQLRHHSVEISLKFYVQTNQHDISRVIDTL